MNINRNNYEEFLLLYADNELSFTQRQAVEDFLEANPDVKTELQAILDSKIHTEHVPFIHKTLLYKIESIVTEENYESYFLLYADNELNEEEKRETERFAALTPALQQELNLILQTKLTADETILFTNKSVLYKPVVPARIIRISWIRMAAAAVVVGIILLAGILLLNKRTSGNTPLLVKQGIPTENKAADKNVQPHKTPAPNANLSSTEKNIASVKEENIESAADDNNLNKRQNINSNSTHQNIAAVTPIVKENKKAINTVTNQADASSGIVLKDYTSALAKTNNGVNDFTNATPPGSVIKEAKSKKIVDAVVGQSVTNPYAVSTLNTEEDEKTNIGVFSVSEDKVQRSGLRGLFRKVKRIISRRNNGEEEDDASKKIYIGSFAIARGN